MLEKVLPGGLFLCLSGPEALVRVRMVAAGRPYYLCIIITSKNRQANIHPPPKSLQIHPFAGANFSPPPTSWPPDSGASPGGAKRPVAMPTTQAGRAPWRWVIGAPPRVLGPGGQGM